MEIEQVAELARTVAALPQDQRDFFNGMVADELAAAADAERVAKLRGMSDVDAVQSAIAWASETVDLDAIPGRMLQGLRDAGFERGQSKQDEISIVLTMSDKSIRRLRGKEEDLRRLCQDLRAGREIVSIFPETEAV